MIILSHLRIRFIFCMKKNTILNFNIKFIDKINLGIFDDQSSIIST
jgi:hypothetical protein